MERGHEFVSQLWEEQRRWAAIYPTDADGCYEQAYSWTTGKSFKEIDRAWCHLCKNCWKAIDEREVMRQQGVEAEGLRPFYFRICRYLTRVMALTFPRMLAYQNLSDAEKEEYEAARGLLEEGEVR